MSRPIRVLHVDDEPDFATTAAAFLEREDGRFDIRTATSADEGLKRLGEDLFDCIVSDYDMPNRNGIEFLQAVRETHPDLPFVLFTGKGGEEIASEAISAGVTEYLQEESGTSQYTVLANRITNAVEKRRASREAERTRRQLTELAQSVTDCVWLFDREWEETVFISGYEELWGRPREAIEEDPQDFLEAVHPDDRESVEASLEWISEGEPTDVEYRIVKNGEIRWVRARREPILDADGNVIRVGGFTRDITERVERQEELEKLNSCSRTGSETPSNTAGPT